MGQVSKVDKLVLLGLALSTCSPPRQAGGAGTVGEHGQLGHVPLLNIRLLPPILQSSVVVV